MYFKLIFKILKDVGNLKKKNIKYFRIIDSFIFNYYLCVVKYNIIILNMKKNWTVILCGIII